MALLSDRFRSYRPLLDRIVFALAILGLLDSAHIALQQQRGFEGGCTGFAPSLLAGSDCGAVTASAAGTFLGLSNATWGLLFYGLVAILTALAAFNVRGRAASFKASRGVLVFVAFLYSLYLVYYQFFVIEQLCALCLVSAGIVTLLLVLHLVEFNSNTSQETASTDSMNWKPSREMTYMGALIVVFGLLLGADAVYLDSREASDVFAEEAASDAPAVTAEPASASQPSTLPDECRYDPEKGRVQDYGRLVNFFDPTVGDPNASVTVIEYFDPNCPHCKTLHEIMMPVVESHSDQARFVFKPFVLWRHSIPQSEALYAAAQEGKFFEMLDMQYQMQQPQTGLAPEQLVAIATQIGMNADELTRRLESGIYQRTLAQEKQEAVDIGVDSTPTVLINGRFVDLGSRSTDCLRRMIEEAANS